MYRDEPLKIAKITLAICGVLLLVVVAWLLRVPLALCFLSLALSAALEPMVRFLIDAKVPRWLALTAVYLAVAIMMIAVPVGLAAPLVSEVDAFASQYSGAMSADHESSPPLGRLQGWLLTGIPHLRELATQWLGSIGEASTLWQILGFTWGVFEVLGNLMVVLVLSLYWSSDRDHFERLWLSLLSVERRAPARDLWRTLQAEIGAYARSEAVQCLLAGVLLWVGLRSIGFPYPALLAVIGAVAWLIPWAGWIVVLATAFMLSVPALLELGDFAIWTVAFPAVAYSLVVLGILEFWIEPRFFDRKRYNSLLVLLMVIVLTELFGITGLVLGPPIAVMLQLVGGELLIRRTAPSTANDQDNRWHKRLDEVWHLVDATEEPAPELVNILKRLSVLVQDARWLKPA